MTGTRFPNIIRDDCLVDGYRVHGCSTYSFCMSLAARTPANTGIKTARVCWMSASK